jgi:hypothetical protein
MSAAVRLAEDVTLWQPFEDASKWFFGASILLVLVVLLIVVTRFNIDR